MKNSCRVSLGAWEYNLLSSWVEAYSKEKIQTSYGENSIIVNMGLASELSWCGFSKQKVSMKLRDEETKYCKQITDWNFKPLEGLVRIDLEAFTDCNETNIKYLDSESFQCVDWEDIEMTISLHLDQCHRSLRHSDLPDFLYDVYNRTCKTHQEACSWEKVEFNETGQNSEKLQNSYQCIEKNNNTIPSAVIYFNNVQPLKATRATGTISTREEEATDMIFLTDSKDNLECLTKEFEIQSFGKI